MPLPPPPPPALLRAPERPTLPPDLRHAWAQSLREARRMHRAPGEPPITADQAAALARLPEGHPQRGAWEGLRAAAAGPSGERAWAQALRSLHQQRLALGRGPESIDLLEAQADLLLAQDLPDHLLRDEALRRRLSASRGADPDLEERVLSALIEAWGGWLEAPRPEDTLAWAEALVGLWQRHPDAEAADRLAPAFQAHAPKLWDYLGRRGSPELKDGLRRLLGRAEPAHLLAAVPAPALDAWIAQLRAGPWEAEVRALWQGLEALDEGTLPYPRRLDLARHAGDTGHLRDLLAQGLRRADPSDRAKALAVWAEVPPWDPALEQEARAALAGADAPTREAWADRSARTWRPVRTGPERLSVGAEELGLAAASPERLAAWQQAVQDLDEGNRGPLEAFLRGEATQALRQPEAPPAALVQALVIGLVAIPLRDGDWEAALADLDRLEVLRRRVRPPDPELDGQVEDLRRLAVRGARLSALAGPAARP